MLMQFFCWSKTDQPLNQFMFGSLPAKILKYTVTAVGGGFIHRADIDTPYQKWREDENFTVKCAEGAPDFPYANVTLTTEIAAEFEPADPKEMRRRATPFWAKPNWIHQRRKS